MNNLTPDDVATAVGTHVELELISQSGETERLSLDIVPDNAADFTHGFLGESSVLAQAILGHKTGDVISYQVGDILEVRVIQVLPRLNAIPIDLTERRNQALQAAVRHSDRTNAIIFASAVNNKWGDYDPAGITDE